MSSASRLENGLSEQLKRYRSLAGAAADAFTAEDAVVGVGGTVFFLHHNLLALHRAVMIARGAGNAAFRVLRELHRADAVAYTENRSNRTETAPETGDEGRGDDQQHH